MFLLFSEQQPEPMNIFILMKHSKVYISSIHLAPSLIDLCDKHGDTCTEQTSKFFLQVTDQKPLTVQLYAS